MGRVLRACVPGLAALLLGAGVAAAQVGSTAQITGTVRDSSGAVLPGVDVTAIQTDTGFRRAAVTEANGLFVLSNLPVGPYRLEAMLSGFRSFQQTGIVLQVNANPEINITLSLGEITRDRGRAGGDAARRNAQPRHRPGDRERAHRGAAAQRPQPGGSDHARRRGGAAAGARRHQPQHAGRPRASPWPAARASASPTCSTAPLTTTRTTT